MEGDGDIPGCLEKYNYSPEAIVDCVRRDASLTLRQVYDATKEGCLNVEGRDGRSAWRALLKGLSEVGNNELMEAEEKFYDVSVIKKDALRDRDIAGSLGLAAACLTLMNARVADRVSQWYERRLYRKIAHSKLGSY